MQDEDGDDALVREIARSLRELDDAAKPDDGGAASEVTEDDDDEAVTPCEVELNLGPALSEKRVDGKGAVFE